MTEEISGAKKRGWRRLCIIASMVLIILFIGGIIILILGMTVFKIKDPQMKLVSASIDGVAPLLSFPFYQIQFNISFNLQILVENPNRASFKHGTGKSMLMYKDSEVGEMNIDPGFIPAQGSATIPCRLSLTFDALSSNTPHLLSDMQAGQLLIQSNTQIPGRVSFLGGIINKHVFAISDCEMTIGFPDMNILKEECRSRNEL